MRGGPFSHAGNPGSHAFRWLQGCSAASGAAFRCNLKAAMRNVLACLSTLMRRCFSVSNARTSRIIFSVPSSLPIGVQPEPV
jgi:hypothetical protein